MPAENVKRKPIGLIISILIIIGLGVGLFMFWQQKNELTASLEAKNTALAEVEEEHKAYVATLEQNFQQEIQRVNEDWGKQLETQKKKERDKLARIYEEVNQIVYSSEDTLRYIDTLESKINQGKALSEQDVEKLTMLGAGLTYVQKQYSKPIHEFKELESFLASQLNMQSVPPKQRYGAFQRMFGKKYKEAVAEYYKDEGKREAYTVAREKVSVAYSSAQRRMASLSANHSEYIKELDSIIAGNEANAANINNFFKNSRKVIDIHQSIMSLQREQAEAPPTGPKP